MLEVVFAATDVLSIKFTIFGGAGVGGGGTEKNMRRGSGKFSV